MTYKKQNLTFGIFGLLLLTACNSSEPDSTPPETPTEVLINAESLQDKALLGTEGIVNVQAATSSEVELELTSVTPMSDASNCKIDTIDGMAFSLSAEQVGECQFEYTVGPRDTEAFVGKASAIARVSVSETASDNTLPNLSETTDRLTEITIDLNTALSGDLDTSSYVVSGDISVLGTGSATAEPSTNKITFTPSEIGVDRVLYSMSDGSTIKLGTIDIAVSDTVNTPPVAENKVLEGKLAKDMLATIDLTDYVSDAEDVVLLDSVRAYNAEANITSQTEHTFTFKSSQPGPHEIAYTITDGRGGYDVGQVYIEVEPDFDLVQDWEDITIADPTIGADITFTAPVSQVLADYTNTSYSEAVMQDGVTGPQGSKIVTMSLEQAQSYCATRNGRLPIQREWSALMAEHGNLFESKNWPANTPYWSADMTSETSGVGIMAIDGLSAELTKATSAAFVTCVLLDKPQVKDFSVRSLNEAQNSNVYTYTLKVFDPDGANAPYQNMGLEATHGNGHFDNGLTSKLTVVDSVGESVEKYTDQTLRNDVLSAMVSASAEFHKPFIADLDSSRSDYYGYPDKGDEEGDYLLGESNMFSLRCGSWLDAAGTPEDGMVGGSGGTKHEISGRDITSIYVGWGNWNHKGDNLFAIARMVFHYKNGSQFACGTTGYVDHSDTFIVPQNYQMKGFRAQSKYYSSNRQDYINAFEFYVLPE
ncbi:beta-prism lectin domain-containing protein [Vibrio campbellii]|uniref:beta-prism lectin domain-containing protein n=1 Tax=Vibrio campbellii TaxID=680 RepID=UPI0040562BE4